MRELDPTQTQRAGRPAVPLAPARGTVAGVGMEVNVDYLGVRVIDLVGRRAGRARRARRPARRGRRPPSSDRLAALVDAVRRRACGEGVRVAGTVLALPGTGRPGHRPAARRAATSAGATSTSSAPCSALDRLSRRASANEANLAARAEAHARRGSPSFVYVSGEVGIGGAIVLDGEIFPGRHGWSGEIGHIVVDAFRGRVRPTAASRPSPARTRCCAPRASPPTGPARRAARRARRGRPARDRRRRAGGAGARRRAGERRERRRRRRGRARRHVRPAVRPRARRGRPPRLDELGDLRAVVAADGLAGPRRRSTRP